MNKDKIMQYVAMIGGFLSALYFFLQSIGIELTYLNEQSINSFNEMMINAVPLILVAYGIWKNQYIVTKKSRESEKELKNKGLKQLS